MEAPDFFHDQTVDAFMASAASSAAAPAEPPPPSTDSNLVVMLPLANQDGAKDGHVLMMPVQMDYATMSQLLGDATSTTAQLMATVESLAAAGELEVTMSDSGPMISYKAPAPPPPAAPPAAGRPAGAGGCGGACRRSCCITAVLSWRCGLGGVDGRP